MSKTRNRNSLLSSHNRTSVSNSTKDELLAMKYVMEKPNIPIYPLNELDTTLEGNSEQNREGPINSIEELTYPDFQPWKDQTQLPEEKSQQEVQKLNNAAYLNKGYFEAPSVSNEYYSARNLIQASLFSSSTNCENVLKELSQHLVNSFKTRNEVINKIRHASNVFKIPPRVILTASKREAWLRDLANPEEPLLKISNKLPHGIKNKMLVESLCSKNVPITRALWFTKCVLYSELLALRKKYQSKLTVNNSLASVASSETFETQWLQEWTHQLVDYIYKFSKDMSSISIQDKKQGYFAKLNYLLNYVQSIYVECLVDKEFFLTSILKFLKEGLPLEPHHIAELLASSRYEGEETSPENWLQDIDMNYGQRLISLSLIKMFWRDILSMDYLSKELSEVLLLNYYFIERIPIYSIHTHKQNHKSALSPHLKSKLLVNISDTVNYLFKFNTNVFIIPNCWILVHEALFNILLGDVNADTNSDEQAEIRKQLTLIKYRNESLMLNMKNVQSTTADSNKANSSQLIREDSGNLAEMSKDVQSNITPLTTTYIQEMTEGDTNFINRNSDDVLSIIDQLDRLKLNDHLAELLKPSAITTSETTSEWRINLKLVIYWAITIYREKKHSSESILIICNFLKRKVLQSLPVKNASNLKAEFGNEILEIIYNLADSPAVEVIDYNLYVLINELYQLKVITISSYLRKLIASGIFYFSPETNGNQQISHNPKVETHISILQNLPVINNKQCDSILKKWTSNGYNFKEKFEKGKDILKKELIDRLITNSFNGYRKDNLSYVRDLTVGLKFLLVNWLTNELKVSITGSPKLIHTNPNIISSLYDFYVSCDNLTVFFKVLIKFILKNEGKVIVCYMDSLFLISKLIVKHFKLVKFIAGNNYESTTTGYELFKLIILNYKDLSTRDRDYYSFNDIWFFIDNVVEKVDSTYNGESNDNKDILTKSNFNQLLYSKETIDSPMKIHANNGTSSKLHETYTSTDFRNDLDTLMEMPTKNLDTGEIKEFVTLLHMDVNDYAFSDISSTLAFVSTILNHLFENVGSLSELQENICMRLLMNAKRILYQNDPNIFYSQIQRTVVSKTESTTEEQKFRILLKKLVCLEILQIYDILLILRSMSNKELRQEKVIRIMYDVLLGNEEIDEQTLFNDQVLILHCARDIYLKKYPNDALMIVLQGLEDEKDLSFDSNLMTTFKNQVLIFLRQFVITHTKLLLNTLLQRLSFKNLVILMNELMLTSEDPIKKKEDFLKLAPLINEFNLPICQILIKIIIENELEHSNEQESKRKLNYMLNLLLDNLKFSFVSYNSYFGELFSYLAWEHKLKIIFILEESFLYKTEFKFRGDDSEGVYLRSDNGEVNLLPVLKDYFKKFLVSSIQPVTTSPKLFQDISDFMLKLLEIVNYDVEFSTEIRRDLYNTISILLRILIIHKNSLTSIIIEQDGQHFSFIKNTISLLNSKFLASDNEKLRILLYDLLLLMKTSITSEVTMNSEPNLGDATSPDVSLVNAQHNSAGEDHSSKATTDITDSTRNASKFASLEFPGSATQGNNLSTVFNLPEPNSDYPLKNYLDDSKTECALMLDDDELQKGGDIHNMNDNHLILLPSRRESLYNAFGILNENNQKVADKRFELKSYEILEDTSMSLNEACIDLSCLDSFTSKENPP